MLPIGSHDEFLELCALSTSGKLTEEEQKKLKEHLVHCSRCRQAKEQFETVVDRAIPILAAETESVDIHSDSLWSEEAAEAAFFKRLALEERRPEREEREVQPQKSTDDASMAAVNATWRQVWSLYVAGMLLFIALGLCAYKMGSHHAAVAVSNGAPTVARPNPGPNISLEEQASDASHERKVVAAQIAARDKVIADLRHQLEQYSAELKTLRATQEALNKDQTVRNPGQNEDDERKELAQRLESAQSEAQLLRGKLQSLQEQSSQDTERETALEAKVDDLTRGLQEKETEVGQQQQLLAHDRDIRELMGARDLYIAEVHDVARSGETQKPFGRVFYTKEKSLIFYAYDLDQEAELKNTSTFQAWGRRGPDRSQALNLGMFYQDNASKKRWVLKFNDPKTLAQIDAVFVTVEPNGGSRKPSGKPLLFAYLKIDPNHP